MTFQDLRIMAPKEAPPVPAGKGTFSGLFSLAYMGWMALALTACAIHPVGMALTTAIVVGWAVTSPRRGVQALSLLVIIKYLNPALASFYPYSGMVFWVCLYVICLSWIFRMRPRDLKYVAPVAYFYLVVLVLSFWSSQPLISILKATSFCGVVSCLLLAYAGMHREDQEVLLRWFFSLALTVLVLSLFTLPFPHIAFQRNGRGFQGILNHPQAFGIFWPPFVLWLVFDSLFQPSAHSRKLEVAFVGVMLAMVFASRSRTGMVAVVVGFMAAVFFLLLSKRLRQQAVIKKGLAVAAAVGLCLVAAAATLPPVREALRAYVYKGGEATSVEEAFYNSRGRIVARQWRNFLKSPWTGNGFGVYAEGFFPSGVKTFAGIPFSASVEKGITPTAVLEEIGLIGATALLMWLGFLAAPLLSTGAASSTAMFMGCLGVNLGEAIFFSLGGNGLFYWLLMGWCWAWSRPAGGGSF